MQHYDTIISACP